MRKRIDFMNKTSLTKLTRKKIIYGNGEINEAYRKKSPSNEDVREFWNTI